MQPELSLEKVEPTQRNARSVISATLLNHEAAYLQSMKVTANVKNKKTSNVILEKEQEDMQMAPNSILISLFLMKKMKWKLGRMYWQ